MTIKYNSLQQTHSPTGGKNVRAGAKHRSKQGREEQKEGAERKCEIDIKREKQEGYV